MGYPTKNFKVFQASAGSGKTYTIIKEYLKLCLKSEKSVSNFQHILAITFTNASANDMKAKIIKNLNDIINSSEVKDNTMEADLIKELEISDAELKRNAQLLLTQIIHDYSNFCVSTIDSFVQKISRSFARDLGLPSQYSVSIDEDDVIDTILFVISPYSRTPTAIRCPISWVSPQPGYVLLKSLNMRGTVPR